MDFEKILKKYDVHWVVKEYPTFDEFMDWLDIDIGISKEKMLDTYRTVANQFKINGYFTHANLVMLKHNKVKNEII